MVKEVNLVRKNLLTRHGQAGQDASSANILGKRLGDQLDRYGVQLLKPDDLSFQTKRAKMGEKFEQFDEFFALE